MTAALEARNYPAARRPAWGHGLLGLIMALSCRQRETEGWRPPRGTEKGGGERERREGERGTEKRDRRREREKREASLERERGLALRQGVGVRAAVMLPPLALSRGRGR